MKKTIITTAVLLGLIILLVPKNIMHDTVARDSVEALQKSNASLKRFTLDNGMICLVKEDHSAPVASIQFWIGTGAIHEQEYLGAGLSHAIEHMIFKGTDTRKPGDITREINNAGGTINAYTSFDRTVFHTDIPSRNWKVGFDVLADALVNPSFPEEEWKKEREVILRELAMGKDDPGRVIGKLLFRTAYTTHPYKYPVIGYEDMFRTITRDDIAGFYDRNYVPDNIIAAIVGDIDAAEITRALKDRFADFKRRTRAPVVLPEEPEQISPRFERKTGAYNISRLEWAYHTVSGNDDDAPALDILAIIFGQGRSSRLNEKIKEELKLAHSIDAWSYTPKEPGIFGISASFNPARETELLEAIEKEIEALLTTPFSSREINKAKRRLIASELASLETMNGQAGSYASGEFYASDPRYAETYLEKISRTTPRDLLFTARKYFAPERRTLVILSPEADSNEITVSEKIVSTAPSVALETLPNKVRLLLHEDNRLPFVYFCVAGTGGLLSETENNAGITHLMANLLTRGTSSKSPEEIAVATESLGGFLKPFSGRNSFGIQARCLSGDIETFMDIIADCITNPAFPEEEVAKEKEIQAAAIDAQYEKPFYVAQSLLRNALFPGHPYRWDPLGSKETLEKISPSDIRKHAREHLNGNNLIISVFGNIEGRDVMKMAIDSFSGIKAGSAPVCEIKPASPNLPVRAKQREPRQQAILLLGFPGIDVTDPRHDAATLLQDAMSGLSSKLNTLIREERGLAYYSGAYNISGIEPGAFVLYAGTREEALPEVESLMKQEIDRIISSGLSSEEITRARNRLIAQYERQLQNKLTMSMVCALNELYGLGHDYIFTTRERYEALTPEQIQEAAKSILSKDKYAASLIMPARKEQSQ